MREIFNSFKYQTIGFLCFIIAAPVFAFAKPIDQGAARPNLYFAACSVGLAALCVIMAHLHQGAHPATGIGGKVARKP